MNNKLKKIARKGGSDNHLPIYKIYFIFCAFNLSEIAYGK